ncbi:MAG TPA: DUF711 family protein [Candidatus Xenobia bacterium]|nr:DUF711 family protein [Candidatus Xenobia bacterium]
MNKHRTAGALLLLASALIPFAAQAAEKPKVRAVTAFVQLDRARYREQVQETLVVLRRAKAVYEQVGYEVQSLRISTQPFPQYTRGLTMDEILTFFRELDTLAKKEGFDAAIGPAMLRDQDDPLQASLLGAILQSTNLSGSLVVAGEDGVYWNAVRTAAGLIKHWSENSPGGITNFNFAATAMVPPYTPFYPGSYHLGEGKRFAVALQSANVVAEALAASPDFEDARDALAVALGGHARAVEAIALQIEQETGWKYEGIDLSPAPLKDVSIGAAIEGLTRARFGSVGTMTAAALITDVLRDLPVKHAGYSGLMVPVLEDAVLAQRWSEGTISLDALLAYSAVCGTGLDTVPLPGDVTVEQLERIIGDMASLAVKLRKPLSARLMPVRGKKAGDKTEFNDPFLVNAEIQPLR